jgi:hypothetical protein
MATKATSPPTPTGLVRGRHPPPGSQGRARPKPPCETTGERGPELRVLAQGAEVGAARKKTGMGSNGALPPTLADHHLQRGAQLRPGGHRRRAQPGLVAQHRQGRLTAIGPIQPGRPTLFDAGRRRSLSQRRQRAPWLAPKVTEADPPGPRWPRNTNAADPKGSAAPALSRGDDDRAGFPARSPDDYSAARGTSSSDVVGAPSPSTPASA